jgi:chromosome segregation ATPase
MSAKLQPQYIMLTDEINAAELAEDIKVQEIAAINTEIAERQKKIAELEASLVSWQNAVQDTNAQNKVAERKKEIAEITAIIKNLNVDLTAAGNALKAIQNQITSLYAQRDAFENTYKNAIMNGKTPEEAEAEANAVATQVKVEQATPWYSNPLIWVGIIAGLAVVGFIIYKLIKK